VSHHIILPLLLVHILSYLILFLVAAGPTEDEGVVHLSSQGCTAGGVRLHRGDGLHLGLLLRPTPAEAAAPLAGGGCLAWAALPGSGGASWGPKGAIAPLL
jgi:hypothetical protein